MLLCAAVARELALFFPDSLSETMDSAPGAEPDHAEDPPRRRRQRLSFAWMAAYGLLGAAIFGLVLPAPRQHPAPPGPACAWRCSASLVRPQVMVVCIWAVRLYEAARKKALHVTAYAKRVN